MTNTENTTTQCPTCGQASRVKTWEELVSEFANTRPQSERNAVERAVVAVHDTRIMLAEVDRVWKAENGRVLGVVEYVWNIILHVYTQGQHNG